MRTAGSVKIGICRFVWDSERRWCSTIFPDGTHTDAWTGEDDNTDKLDVFAGWGYARTARGRAIGMIEHEAAHNFVPNLLFGLDCSPEFNAAAHGVFRHNPKGKIPPDLIPPIDISPVKAWTVTFEEALNIATVCWIRRGGHRKKVWNAAFPDTDPLDFIAERTNLATFLDNMRARLDALWKD
jgi:hypothetical protein